VICRHLKAIAVAVALLGAAACATNTPVSAAARALTHRGVHTVPSPPLAASPLLLTYTQVDDRIFAWGERHPSGPRSDLMFRPVDIGAVLDPTTLLWTRLPAVPLAHPTEFPQVTASGGRLVVIGNACLAPPVNEAGWPGFGEGPNCALGPIQWASFDPSSGRWTTAPVHGFNGERILTVSPVGRQVLVTTGGDPDSAEHFALLNPRTGRWTAVAPPDVGVTAPMVCASRGKVFAIGLPGTEVGGFGPLEATVLRPGATAWSAASPPRPTPAANQVDAGCTGGGVLAVATTLTHPTEVASPGDVSTASIWVPGRGWAVVPPIDFGQPVLDGAASNSPGLFDLDQLEGDRVGVYVGGLRLAVFNPATRAWSPGENTVDPHRLAIHIGRAQLEASGKRLIAVTP
jgi:hypothetical protein